MLPDKLSALIRVAVADLEKCERDENYIVDMDYWHIYRNNKCLVCLAGAVMAKSCNIPTTMDCSPFSFTIIRSEANKLSALDSVRIGDIQEALGLFDIEHNCDFYRDVTEYSRSPEKFKSELLTLADELEEYGY